jgi:hypothetical protein
MTCICVLGMHRSGTSCLTGIMQKLGVELGDVFTENLHNKRGNRENERIVILNDAVLASNQGAWNNPTVISTWTDEQTQERDLIINELRNTPSGFWGFKDPRTLFTLPFWLDTIEAPRFIGTFRHPHRVALSLNKRDNTPFEQGWALWQTYNQRLMELANKHRFGLADFDLAPEVYLDNTLEKLLALGLDPQLAADGSDFFDSGLLNQTGSDVDQVSLPESVAALYQQLQEYNQNYQPQG